MKSWKRILFHIVLPMILGALIYAVLDPEVAFLHRIGFPGSGAFIREKLWKLPPFIRNYIPDMLWAIALSESLALILGMEKGPVPVLVTALLFIAAMECLQLVPGIPGTFDLLDILLEWIAAVSVLIIGHYRSREAKA